MVIIRGASPRHKRFLPPWNPATWEGALVKEIGGSLVNRHSRGPGHRQQLPATDGAILHDGGQGCSKLRPQRATAPAGSA